MKRIILIGLVVLMFVSLVVMHPAPGGTRQRYTIHRVTVRGGTAYLAVVNHSTETATQAGMDATLKDVCVDLSEARKALPGHHPDVLVVQPGLGSSPYQERRNIARMTLKSGKDFAISIDMSDRFKWPWESGDLRMVVIDEPVTRRFERLVVAANRLWARPPDAVLESQATRLLFPGTPGSITAADLCERSELQLDFKLNRVVCVGVPLRDVEVGRKLEEDRIGEIVAVTTPQQAAVIGAAPIRGHGEIEVTLSDGSPVRHKYLFKEKWPDGSINPVPELIGEYLR